MSKITDLGSPDRELSARDIKRKEDKLRRTKNKLQKNLSARRRHNLEFKVLKTQDQIDTGLSGIRPTKLPLGFTMPYSPLNQNEFDVDYSGAKAVDLGNIPPSNFTKAKKKLVKDYGGADNPEYQMEKGAYFYDKQKDKMRSSYLEYPEDAEGVDERYLGKNWDNKSPLDRKSPLNQGHENPKHGSSYIETYPTATGKWGGKLPEWEANKVWSDSSSTWISNPKDVNLTRPQLERKSDSLRIDRLQKDFDKKWKTN